MVIVGTDTHKTYGLMGADPLGRTLGERTVAPKSGRAPTCSGGSGPVAAGALRWSIVGT